MEKQDASDVHSDAHSIADAPDLKRENPTDQISNLDKHSIEDVKTGEANEEEWQYVTGFKLGVVIVSVTLVAFVMMLDMSIVSTVISSKYCNQLKSLLLTMILGHSSNHKRFSLSS